MWLATNDITKHIVIIEHKYFSSQINFSFSFFAADRILIILLL